MSTRASADPFPFVVGFARSGTTLVRAMLDSHPEVAIPGESHFIVRFGRDRHRYDAADGFDLPRLVRDVTGHPRFVRWGLSEVLVRESLLADPPTDYPDAVRMLYAIFARSRQKRRYGDKTPTYLLHIPLLASLFAEARFVHVVRDGRDVCLSHLDQEIGQRTVERAALYWKRHVLRGRLAGRRLGHERYRELRYEDLVADPESALRSVCDFLGLSFEPQMLRYFERAEEIKQPTRHPSAHANLARAPTQGLRDWRRQMRPEDVAVFEALAGDVLVELGYEESGIRLRGATHVRVRARAAQATAGFLAHRFRKRLGVKARS